MFNQQINTATGEMVLSGAPNYGLIPVNKIPISQAIASMTAVFPSKSDMSPESRVKSAQLLNQLLANLNDLQSQFKVAHWNIKGAEFIYLHKLFGKIYSELLLEAIDSVAERIAGLGGMAMGTARDTARDTQLQEFKIDQYRARPYLDALTTNLGYCAGQARAIAIELDCGCGRTTANFLQDVAKKLDDVMYLLESQLQ
jgi:starvation-inducible DNA-binding protein